jgi:tellurite methyltransferase
MTLQTSNKHCTHTEHSPLLETYLAPLQSACKDNHKVLDLACGFGRNGQYLAEQGLPVVFADKSSDALNTINLKPDAHSKRWQVDFEIPGSPLSGKQFAAIMVFRYLHRDLFDPIKQAIKPGGMIIYETFTVEQANIGRPKNPNFLLESGELNEVFSTWKVLHQFEGIDNGNAIVQIVAVKP